MGADLYRESAPGKNPERDAALDDLNAREAAGEDIHDRESGKPTWGDVHNVEGWYFRDSYNGSSLFWKLDLSWWQSLEPYLGPNGDGDMQMITDEDGEAYGEPRLYPEGCRKLAREVRNRSELLMFNCRDLPDEGEEVEDIFGKGRTLDKRYFSEKFDRLIRFLETTAEAGDTIYCSV